MKIYLSIYPSIYARHVSHASQSLPNVYPTSTYNVYVILRRSFTRPSTA